MKVLFDSNALMIPSQFRVDVFTELGNIIGAYEPLILTEVLHELKGLSRGCGREGSAARFALDLASRCREVASGYSEGSVDEKVLAYAREHRCMVVTNDRKLKDLLLSEGVPVITLMQRKRLGLLRR
ncbi:MAG: nucleotide-binding protein [Methanolinea sp.]|nr:nucleotide-binding protein [Methanolinea sp.]